MKKLHPQFLHSYVKLLWKLVVLIGSKGDHLDFNWSHIFFGNVRPILVWTIKTGCIWRWYYEEEFFVRERWASEMLGQKAKCPPEWVFWFFETVALFFFFVTRYIASITWKNWKKNKNSCWSLYRVMPLEPAVLDLSIPSGGWFQKCRAPDPFFQEHPPSKGCYNPTSNFIF